MSFVFISLHMIDSFVFIWIDIHALMWRVQIELSFAVIKFLNDMYGVGHAYEFGTEIVWKCLENIWLT